MDALINLAAGGAGAGGAWGAVLEASKTGGGDALELAAQNETLRVRERGALSRRRARCPRGARPPRWRERGAQARAAAGRTSPSLRRAH